MNRENFNKHKELILAWAAGATIQYLSTTRGAWCDVDTPSWMDNHEYRIKPAEPRVWYIPVYTHGSTGYMRDARLYEKHRDSLPGVISWIRVVEDTSFVPYKPST